MGGMLQPLCLLACFLIAVGGMAILSKSRLERCFHDSEDGGSLPCDQKIVLDMAVPSGSSGGEASLVAQVVRVQEDNTQAMKTILDPPVITIHKTATFALYALTYVTDVAYKPEEQFVKTRKCEPDAGADVVQAWERLRDENSRVIQETEYDKNRINRRLQPQYIVEGRFQRINQHPNAGADTFSFGVTEVLNTNLLVELSADDIEYVYQRSPAKIIGIHVPTFEALSQIGTGYVTTKNIGKLESSYSLTFDCSSDISHVEEQSYIMKLDRAECQFATGATVLEIGTQIDSSNDHKGGTWGFFDAIKAFWRDEIDFFTGRLCRAKCSSLFDFSCHIQYLCIGWLGMFGLLLATLPMVAVLLWLLHQKGVFDPLYTTGGRTCWGRSRTTARTRGTRKGTTTDTRTATATTPTGTTHQRRRRKATSTGKRGTSTMLTAKRCPWR